MGRKKVLAPDTMCSSINLDGEDRRNCEVIRVRYRLPSMADAIRYALKLVSTPNAFLVLREGGPEYHVN